MILIVTCFSSLLICQPIHDDARFSFLTVQQAWPCRRKWCLTTWREISPCPCGSNTITTPDRTNTSKSTFSAMRMITVKKNKKQKNKQIYIYIYLSSIFVFRHSIDFSIISTEMNRHHFSLFIRNCRLILLLRREFGDGDLKSFRPAEFRWKLPQVTFDFWIEQREGRNLIWCTYYTYTLHMYLFLVSLSLNHFCICVFSCGFLINCWAPNNNNNSPKLIWTFPQLGLRWPVASLRRVHGVPWSSALRRWPPYGCQQE